MRGLFPVAAALVFSAAALVYPPAAAATPAQIPGWEVFCSFDHRAQVDPVVSPGVKPSAHLHDFFGNRGTDENSTPTSLRAGTTNCELAADRAAYWVPTLYSSGVAQTATRLHAYYRWGNVTRYQDIVPLTAGAEILAGDKSATAGSPSPTSRVGWSCGGQGEALTTAPINCSGTGNGPNGSDEQVLHFFFPNCLKTGGVGSNPANYTYSSNGACASATPVPRLSEDFAWAAEPPSTITLSSGSVYTAHADFMTGWVTAKMNALTAGCINAGVQCGPLTDAHPGPGG
jgi:hypothetical protein